MAIWKIAIIDGHPDPREDSFSRALASAYVSGAASAGHGVRRIPIARIDFPIMRSRREWENGDLPDALGEAWDAIEWADHIVIAGFGKSLQLHTRYMRFQSAPTAIQPQPVTTGQPDSAAT